MTTSIWCRRLRWWTLSWLAAAAWLGTSSGASAQTVRGIVWEPGVTLSGFVGASSTASSAAPAAGGAIGWELTPHLTIEGRGTWLRHHRGPTDFAASINALVHVLPPRAVVPFALAGFGMYGATVDSGSPDAPAFYRDRMPPNADRPVFEDLLLTFGGGADVFVTSRLALRPEVTLHVIATRDAHLTKTVYGVYLSYHFEAHGRP